MENILISFELSYQFNQKMTRLCQVTSISLIEIKSFL